LAAAILLCAAPQAFADGRNRHPLPDVAEPPVHAHPVTPPVQPAQPTPASPQTNAAPATPAPAAAQTPAIGRTGQIALMDNGLTINVPSGYKFYSAEEALAFLHKNNAQTPSGSVLGLIAPAAADIRADGAWATVLSYDPINYVPAESAGGLAAPDLEERTNAARETQGRPFEGFAAQPAYDAATYHLTWAERTAPPASGGKDFRHEQRLLGRYGVAGLTSVGSADQQPAINTAAPALFAMISFPDGRKYTDFSPASDATSGYSIPGLVTGVPEANPNLVADAASAGGANASEKAGAGGGLQGVFPWIALGIAALAGVGYMLSRRGQSEDARLSPED
jgi:uncharacterized membrane-anchored protein